MEGEISAGHARALLPLKSERSVRSMLARILDRGLSVRDVERSVAGMVSGSGKGKPAKKRPSPEIADLESRLTRKLGCRVHIRTSGKGGRLEIRCSDLDELNTVIGKILKADS